ncbi:topoisomerase DNA-binding C4 zinc finger domain-containing protein [Haladaptatus caseinilyticus]|uniref:topoisomerase DNA-binding C4 zinc finger domain-containing protein n=1 Tax=Haladaptatus caseinilyticus TaxID=2993314 RepID=UPI00224B6093|nr:topoisomerase DNA-binding C4 zinc finger domain-containing protein [Haladaptatus caseinilyticus]
MTETIRVFAGDCTITTDGDTKRRRRGEVVAVLKPDDTLLVHDVDGYQPVEWLTRAETAHASLDGDTFTLVAATSDRRVRVDCHTCYGISRYPGSKAGIPVGICPDCDSALTRARGTVSCLGRGREYSIPRHARVGDDSCECGLPTMYVERGAELELCLDRGCGTILDAVGERFDREWDCPECGGDLRILRRGGIIAGCDRYPDCDTGFGVPNGGIVDSCACGLPVFRTPTGRRCLNTDCEEFEDNDSAT